MDVGGRTMPGAIVEEVESRRDAYKDVGGTIPRMESVESSLEQRPRQCPEHIVELRPRNPSPRCHFERT